MASEASWTLAVAVSPPSAMAPATQWLRCSSSSPSATDCRALVAAATPGGVTSFHSALPAGRMNSCQKLLWLAAEPPMTVMAQVPDAVPREVARNDAPADGAPDAGPGPELTVPPQPAVSSTAARTSAI